MRVSEEARVTRRRQEEARRDDFGAAMRRAEAQRAEAKRDEVGRAERRSGELASERRGGEARGGADRARGGDGADASLGAVVAGRSGGEPAKGDGSGAPATSLAAAPLAGPGETARVGPGLEPGRAALAQAVRALPPVIEAFHASGQPALAIDFGRSLGVELRQAAGGVELRLSAAAALRPAARVELVQLCRSLEARGVVVVSAEVRGGPPGADGHEPGRLAACQRLWTRVQLCCAHGCHARA